jgi:PAS domain S-box-containing protein
MRRAGRRAHAGGVSTVDRLASWIGEVLAHHMLEASPEPVVVLNPDRRVVLVSRSAASLDWSRDTLVGREWSDLLHPDDVGSGTNTASPEDDTPVVRRRDVTIRRGDGEWQSVSMMSYTARLDDVGVVSVLVLRPLLVAA